MVRKGGRVLIYVWAFEQEKKKYEDQDVLVPWHLQEKYDKEQKKAAPEAAPGTAPVEEEKKSEKVFKRYYHMFKEGELATLVKEAKVLDVLRTYYDHENWCVECAKL